jgi:hypothetical protein
MKKIILLLVISGIGNFCSGQTNHFKLSIGIGLKKNFLYDYNKSAIIANNFDVTTKINPFPIIIIGYKLKEKLDLEFSASFYSNAYNIKQSLTKDTNQAEYQYRVITYTGNFCLGVKYSKARHSFICGLNIDYNSFMESIMTSANSTSLYYETNVYAPFENYVSTGFYIGYKIGFSKRLSAEIKYSQDFSRLPSLDINTKFITNSVTDNYSGHIHPNYGYIGLMLIYH